MHTIDQARVTVTPSGLLNRKDAAAYIGRQPDTLATWAKNGRGPSPVKVAGRYFYRLSDLNALLGVTDEPGGNHTTERLGA